MNAVIIEDEALAVERLKVLLGQVSPDTTIDVCLDSVADAVDWFRKEPPPDFVLLDIHLSDGSAFEIFRKVKLEKPVIFITAYDQYALDAFTLLSIDYLLKPVSADSLNKALLKLKKWSVSDPGMYDYKELLAKIETGARTYKTRFLASIGNRSFFVPTTDVAYFSADDKIVNLVTHDGCRYVVDYTMEALEKILDPVNFFRSNRSVIISSAAIEQIRPFLNGRLKLILKTGNLPVEFLVSRERVSAFKIWAEQ